MLSEQQQHLPNSFDVFLFLEAEIEFLVTEGYRVRDVWNKLIPMRGYGHERFAEKKKGSRFPHTPLTIQTGLRITGIVGCWSTAQ